MKPFHLALAAALLLAAPLARAQVVTTTADSGPGSLRAVVAAATNNAIITFATNLSGQTIQLTSIQLSLNTNLTIDASALPGGVTIDGKGKIRLFQIGASDNVTLVGLTLSNGRAADDYGGAIYNEGVLTVNRCTLATNSATLDGGGIFNPAGSQLTLLNSTFHANTAREGGAVRCLGATLTATNCTFTANTARIGGACSIADGGTSQLNHLTVAGNQATDAAFGGGGGLCFYNHSTALQNSIVAANTSSGTGGDIACNGGTLTYQGANLVQSVGLDSVTMVGPAPRNAPPLLAALGNYGGSTPTLPPLVGSPAIDAGVATLLTTDQRGLPRQFGAQVDLGAVERQPWIVTTLADSGSGSLRMAVSLATPGNTIIFAASLTGQSIQLNGPLVLNKSLTIDASALPAGIKLLGSGRVLEITAGQTVLLRSLEARNGYATQGGGIYNAGTLTLDGCTLANNGDGTPFGAGFTAQGGGIYNAGTLTLNQSTLTGNFANDGAAIYTQNGASLTVNDSSITDNLGNSGPGGIRNLGALTLNKTVLAGNIGGSLDPNLANSGTWGMAVYTNADSGSGSLRDLVASAPAGASIVFATHLSGQTLTLTSGEILLNAKRTIDASALLGGLTISGNQAGRIFRVGASGNITLLGLTLANGRAAGNHGGAIYNGGVLTVDRCTVAANTATLDGGGIFNPAGSQLTLLNSTFTGNTAREGGAVRCTGAAFAATNCTFTLNTAGIGGACSIADGGPDAQLSHVTVAGNQATDATYGGGGLFFYAQNATLHNSIIEGDTAPTGPDIGTVGSTLSATGKNLLGNVSGSGLSEGPSVIIGNPLLAALGNYGGPTQTMPPGASSPAIDGGGATALSTDQRGWPRPLGLAPDLGAVEFAPFSNTPIVGLPGVGFSSVAWGDYDQDGRLDFLLTGGGLSQLWRNTGRGFTNVTDTAFPNGAPPGVGWSSVVWGDYDNDGRLDFLLTGTTNGEWSGGISQLWRNTGSGFTNVTASVAPGLPQVHYSSVAWGDYDQDGRLDFLLTGQSSGSLVSQLWRNNAPLTNTPPTAPTGLAMTATPNAVMLSWNSATDGQTPAPGLTYNVRAGTTPGANNLLAAHVNGGTGFRRVPALGNAMLRHTLPLTGLTNGQTVYWSVQAVDTSFAGGPFATETSVVTIPTLALTPSSATNAVVSWTPPTWGWFLQESADLTSAPWSNSPSGESNPANVSTTNAANFYRLARP